MPFLVPAFAAVGTALGATGASASVVGGLATAATVGGIGAGVYGAYQGGQDAKKQANAQRDAMGAMSATNLGSVEPAPTQADASAIAKQEAEKRKRAMALAGGKTLLTSSAPALSGTTGSKSLLGS